MRLDINKIFGTSSNTQLNFDVSTNYIAYIASGGVIASNIDHTTKTLINQRFFCSNAPTQSNYQSSNANAYLNLYVSNQKDLESEVEKDEFGLPKLTQPVQIDESNSSISNTLNDLSISPPKSTSPLNHSKAKSIACVTISPDEKYLAVGESGTNPRILVFSLAPSSLRTPILTISEHNFGIQCLKFSSDSKYLMSFGDDHDGFVYIWKIQGINTKIVAVNKNSTKINGCFWDYDNDLIFTFGIRTIKIWRFEEVNDLKREKIRVKNVILGEFLNSNFVYLTKFGARSDYLTLTSKGEVCLLDPEDNNLKLKLKLPSQTSTLLPDVDELFFNEKDLIKSINVDLFSNLKKDPSPLESPSKIKFEPFVVSMNRVYDTQLIYLTTNEEIKIHDIETRETKDLISRANIQGIKETVRGLYFWTKNGLIKRYEDNLTVKQISLHSGTILNNEISSLDISKDNELIVADADGNLLLYGSGIDTPSQSLKIHQFGINALKYFVWNNFEYIVTIARDRMIQVLYKNQDKWALLETLATHKANVTNLVIHQNKIIVGSIDRCISIHQITEKNSIEFLKIITVKSTPLTINIFDEEMIVSLMDKSLQIYDASKDSNYELKRSLKLANDSPVDNLIKLTKENSIIVSCSDKSIRIFSYSTGAQIFQTWGHSESIKALILFNEENELISLSGGCLFNWKIITQATSTLPSEPSTHFTPIIRKIIRKESPLKTPSKTLSTSTKTTLTPVTKKTPPNRVMTPNGLKSSPTLMRSPTTKTPSRSTSPVTRNSTIKNAADNSSPRFRQSSSVTSNPSSPHTRSRQSSSSLSSGLRPNSNTGLNSSSAIKPASKFKSTKENHEENEIEDLLFRLKRFKINYNSYSVEEVELVKEEIKDIFNYEETMMLRFSKFIAQELVNRDNLNPN
ncbi:hypothetical protein WICMUC_001889 [Wickerhamomyces mucosus]|uniref:Uncharacterized protein n=1 Tax=Wickerhamomyces mucosus TaxID=1378264 RepID=A0A9P8TFR0_9ASCO|nr:hypothetical protein WICMUC_001889 [Wickerhamomyces mucosus]